MKKLSFFPFVVFLLLVGCLFFGVKNTAAEEMLSVSVTSPVDGQTIPYGGTNITAEVTELSPSATVTNVDFYLNDQVIFSDTEFPYQAVWNMMSQVPGNFYSIKAVAYDSELNTATSPTVTVQVEPDVVAPVFAITSPYNMSIIPANSLILIQAQAMDNYQVRNIVFFVNGQKICNVSEDNPFQYYKCYWETPRKKNVIYTISATAFDYFGNSSDYSISVKAK